MNAPFIPAGRWDIFRAEFAKMTPAEALDALAWLLDPAIGDPAPDLPDELTDALLPVYAAYSKAYDGLQGALELVDGRERRERADDFADHLYDMMRELGCDPADPRHADHRSGTRACCSGWQCGGCRGSVERGGGVNALAPVPAADICEELLAHLGAAKMQLLPSDDKIISEHIHAAHALALVLFRSNRP